MDKRGFMRRFTSLFLVASMLFMTSAMSGCDNGGANLPDETEPSAVQSDETDITEPDLGEPTTTTTVDEYAGIVDINPPVVLSANSSVKLTVGDVFDPNNYISYIDDYDRNPVLSMENPVDTTVAGTYETAMVLTDYSGNSVRKELTVKVVGAGEDTPTNTPTPAGNTPTPTPVPQPSSIRFRDFVNTYAGPNREFGIDVSKWQGDVDYVKVKNAGCSFVIIRAGVYYQGEFNFDSKFEQNFRNAKAAGLKVGLYFFTPVTSEAVLRENVDRICEALNGEELDFPIAYDMETWSRFQQYHMNLQDLNGLFYAFCEQAESHGYSGMLYNSKLKLETVWDANDHPVWLAHYTAQTSYEGDYIMWQVNNTGRIEGINGDVDLNILYTDRYNAI